MNENLLQKTGNGRIISYDIIRLFGAFAVVWLHSTDRGIYHYYHSGNWEIAIFYASLVRWAVPIFIMVSGALFLDLSKRIEIGKLWRKNITHIFLIFIFWSAIYTLYSGISGKEFSDIFKNLIQGPYHLWFLKLLIGLYIVVPILRTVLEGRMESYFILLSTIAVFVIPLILHFIGYYSMPAQSVLEGFYSALDIKMVSGYVGYFVLGHYLSHHQLKRHVIYSIYLLGILSVVMVCTLTYYETLRIGYPTEAFFSNLYAFTFLEATALFLFLTRLRIPEKYHQLLINASGKTLGIYIIHVLVMEVVTKQWGIDEVSYNLVLYTPCYTVSIFCISFILISILTRLPLLKKFVS